MVLKPNQTRPNIWFGLVTKSILVKTDCFSTSGSVVVQNRFSIKKPVYLLKPSILLKPIPKTFRKLIPSKHAKVFETKFESKSCENYQVTSLHLQAFVNLLN